MLGILLKGIGALCIVITGGMIGWRKGEQVMRHVQVLEEMLAVLSSVKSNLQFQCDRTYDVLHTALCAKETKVLYLPSEMLKDGPELDSTLNKMLGEMRDAHAQEMSEPELQWFCTALTSLGKYSAQQEEQKLAYAITQLDAAMVTAKKEAKQQQKLYRTVGVSLGGVVALLLL